MKFRSFGVLMALWLCIMLVISSGCSAQSTDADNGVGDGGDDRDGIGGKDRDNITGINITDDDFPGDDTDHVDDEGGDDDSTHPTDDDDASSEPGDDGGQGNGTIWEGRSGIGLAVAIGGTVLLVIMLGSFQYSKRRERESYLSEFATPSRFDESGNGNGGGEGGKWKEFYIGNTSQEVEGPKTLDDEEDL